MAKLHNYYVLCPLIDQKSFLGISQDKEEECVIVTLGRNVVNKYRLSDQKQTGGWTSRDHITSTVIYDKEQQCYAGVFNNNTIKLWKDETQNLDKVKKNKFSVNILKLIPRNNKTFIIFSNGNCASLSYGLENRSTYEGKSLIKDTETVVDIACYKDKKADHICYIIKNNSDNYVIVDCVLRDELGDLETSKLSKVKVTRTEDVYVVGRFINVSNKVAAVYMLWSDSKLTVYDLLEKSWRVIGSVPWISTLSNVSMSWMGNNHLILFGSNTNQDGALIVAYNVILGVGSCRYPMKMYSENAKLYCFTKKIILEASNHIGVLPFTLETERNLSTLLGSHEILQDETTEVVNWGMTNKPLKFHKEFEEYLKLGLPERTICSQIIPSLLEKNNYEYTLQILKQLKDVPESTLVLLLNYAIKLIYPNNVDITNREEFFKFCNGECQSKKQINLYKGKFEFLNYLFEISFSDALLIPYIKNKLHLNHGLFLMSYITYLLTDSSKLINTGYESKLLDWCILLMDAFYQQFVMTKDEKVTYVLENTLKTVGNLIDLLLQVDSMLPLLNKILSGHTIDENQDSLSYNIVLMQL